MIYKYYIFELVTLDGSKLKTPSLTCKFYRWMNPCKCVRAAKNELEIVGLENHRIKSMRRIK